MATGDLLLVYAGEHTYNESLSTGGRISAVQPEPHRNLRIVPETVTGGVWPIPGLEVLEFTLGSSAYDLNAPISLTVEVYELDFSSPYYDISVALYQAGAGSTYYTIRMAPDSTSHPATLRCIYVTAIYGDNVNDAVMVCDVTPSLLSVTSHYRTVYAEPYSNVSADAIGTGRFLSPQSLRTPAGAPIATVSCVYNYAITLAFATGLYDSGSTPVGGGTNYFGIRVSVYRYGSEYRVETQLRTAAGALSGTQEVAVTPGTGIKYVKHVVPSASAMAVIAVDTDRLQDVYFVGYGNVGYMAYSQLMFLQPSVNPIIPTLYALSAGGDNPGEHRAWYVVNMSDTETLTAYIFGAPSTPAIAGSTLRIRADASIPNVEVSGWGLVGDGVTTGVVTVVGGGADSLTGTSGVYTPHTLGTLAPGQSAGFWVEYKTPYGYSGPEMVATTAFGVTDQAI